MEQELIFIQIASYRDPELIHTLRDCVAKADKPDNLRFTIAWQHDPEDEWDSLYEFTNDVRFNILDIDYKESKGVCWARNQVQQHYGGEKYTLQLDSHHRFVPSWDTLLIDMLKSLQAKGSAKPLITTYIPSYDPTNDPDGRVIEAWWLQFDRFTPEGAVFTRPAMIPNWQNLTEPIPSRFYSAHFAFTVGEFAVEVQHDPEYYFHGEEISIAVRAYTWGYDLYHPHIIIAWHEYTRKLRIKHWDENVNWYAWDVSSLLRNKILFAMDGHCSCERNFGKYNFGTVRTVKEYEAFAGLRFRDRGIQQYTLQHNLAPNPKIANPVEYLNSFTRWYKHCIDIQKSDLQEKDYTMFAVAFEDAQGQEIFRQDADAGEIAGILNTEESYYMIWREFDLKDYPLPRKWIVWPFSASKGWCARLTGDIRI